MSKGSGRDTSFHTSVKTFQKLELFFFLYIFRWLPRIGAMEKCRKVQQVEATPLLPMKRSLPPPPPWGRKRSNATPLLELKPHQELRSTRGKRFRVLRTEELRYTSTPKLKPGLMTPHGLTFPFFWNVFEPFWKNGKNIFFRSIFLEQVFELCFFNFFFWVFVFFLTSFSWLTLFDFCLFFYFIFLKEVFKNFFSFFFLFLFFPFLFLFFRFERNSFSFLYYIYTIYHIL